MPPRYFTGVTAGNLLGSDLFNILGVPGVAAAIQPMSVDATAIPGMLWVVALILAATAMLWTEGELTPSEGAFLVLIAVVRWTLDLVGLGPTVS